MSVRVGWHSVAVKSSHATGGTTVPWRRLFFSSRRAIWRASGFFGSSSVWNSFGRHFPSSFVSDKKLLNDVSRVWQSSKICFWTRVYAAAYGRWFRNACNVSYILLQECVLHLQDKLANAKDRATAAEECKLMLDEQMKVPNWACLLTICGRGLLIYDNQLSRDHWLESFTIICSTLRLRLTSLLTKAQRKI